MADLKNVFDSRASFELDGKKVNYYRIRALEERGLTEIARLPYSIRILLESVLRQHDGKNITQEHIENLAKWGAEKLEAKDVPFKPARVILQDFTGVPAVVDLASLRKAMTDLGGDPREINPEVPVDLVIDHSLQVDKSGSPEAMACNIEFEFQRNQERYGFLKWAQNSFSSFRVVPPATGIIHQVNLEYLASVIQTIPSPENEREIEAFPDTLVGTDSHTTMINGLGVLGWGVGGIEAEAGMLGQPSYFPVPEVIGVKLTGSLPNGVTATDLALKVTQVLRQKNVVGKFVEFFGPGYETLTLADRATVANMAPEYGATCGYFPIDEETINYLRLTGRDEEQIRLIEEYCRRNDLFYSGEHPSPKYSEVVEVDLSNIGLNLAGPKRPQDLIPLKVMKEEVRKIVGNSFESTTGLKHGDVVIASITSCTNTSNPFVMLGAGLLAKKAVEKGLKVSRHVKTSLAPGSRVVTSYLKKAGLQEYLDHLGFHLVGYGCATCIGNSGPLKPEIEEEIRQKDLVVASIVSGNRNFEGRIHPLVKANYLASPPLVVAYALTGTVDFDFETEPLGYDQEGTPVFLSDIWPSTDELNSLISDVLKPELFKLEYENVFKKNNAWNEIQVNANPIYTWDEKSTYIQNPPFFENLSPEPRKIEPFKDLRVLAKLGDSVTTDHISPAGSIAKNSPAGEYLMNNGIQPHEFNSYGSRRGNHEVMMRGTFANIRIKNQLAPGTEGGLTTHIPSQQVTSIFDAAMKYKDEGTELIVIAGKDYGMGSSRDWAAKGPALLGVKAVIAESFERIHRSNLVMMGILPLQFVEGENAESLGLTGFELYDILIDDSVKPGDSVKVMALSQQGLKEFSVIARFDSEIEIDYFRNGGILSMVLRKKIQ